MPKPKIAVLYFPGNNCEEETRDRCIDANMDAKIIRWNSKENLSNFDGFIIPGGFSYEDRIRAGVIAAKEKVMDKVRKEVKNGKLLLGICNGAQVLVETGLIPGLKDQIEMALAPNINPLVSGYYDSWVYIKNINKNSNAFNYGYEKNEIINLPIAHGEGCFTTKDKSLIKKLEKNKQIIFKYCNESGKIVNKFPINPNGAINNIAAISNKQGNVMAIMPHPERASFNWQVPNSAKNNEKTNAIKIFESMKKYIEDKI
ncbi:MAG: phosphoribosylformylglycinamidine synthase I [Candidatus Woesearchaeota archaeon]|jgi:phosphoribosylformylglycinamidine synthase|nr:phosphoribosylformylglycinamidine synthase I [Candidatus Woesearchaeota archaeon]|tara:strand:+ start:581 stop:1354 length:774 start_codon:yes stop_codon:yes gene_type:complete